MLTYLSGVKRQKSGVGKKVLKAALKASPAHIAVKAVIKKGGPQLQKQLAKHRILQNVAEKSPLAAQKMQKAMIDKSRRDSFKKAGEPLIMKAPQLEEPEVEEIAEELEDMPAPEDNKADEINIDDSELGTVTYRIGAKKSKKAKKVKSSRSVKKAAKKATKTTTKTNRKTAKAATKNAAKAGKPRNVKKAAKASNKAAKTANRKLKIQSKASKVKGGFKDVAKSFIEKGSEVLKTQLQNTANKVKDSQGPDAAPVDYNTGSDQVPNPEKKPETKKAGMSTLQILGLVGVGVGLLYAANR